MAIKFVDVKYKEIFENVNLKINDSEITSIIGKNGSGKTTLLNLIYCLDLGFDGKIILNKKQISNKLNNNQLKDIRSNMYYLSQDYKNQLFNINVLEDIKYNINNLKLNKLDELLNYFNLDKEILNRNYNELSDSEIKKILLIICFIKDYKILLLDDPTSALDYKTVLNLVKLLKKEKRNGKTILIASQDEEFLISISDKIIVIGDKKIEEKENKYEVFENKTILEKVNIKMPNIMQFKEILYNKKRIKLLHRDNINDLIKDIYRNAK